MGLVIKAERKHTKRRYGTQMIDIVSILFVNYLITSSARAQDTRTTHVVQWLFASEYAIDRNLYERLKFTERS